MFEVQGWRYGLPSSGHVLLKLIEMVDDWKTTARDGPITVVCMYVTLYYIILHWCIKREQYNFCLKAYTCHYLI